MLSAKLPFQTKHVAPPGVEVEHPHPVAGQTLDQAEDGAVEDVRDHTAVETLFLLPGAELQLS